jgi:hypothetical protein
VNVFGYLVGAPISRGPHQDLASWLKRLDACPFKGHIERAMWAGFHADRLGYAFAGGYAAALGRLLANVNVTPRGATCLAATESGGAHPMSIKTRLDKSGGELVLNGEKTFATLAPQATDILVIATRGLGSDGKNRLRMVRVAKGARGMTMSLRKETPFAPEIPHAILTFENVVVADSDVLPGDGYDVYLKPFRTIEDIHVLASVVGYLAGAARAYGWDRGILVELTTIGLALVDVSARDLTLPVVHIAVAGLFATTRRLGTALDAEWRKSSTEEAERWRRDAPLLVVAETARQKRTEAALKALGAT